MIDTIRGYIILNKSHKSNFKTLLQDSTKTIRKNGYTKTTNLLNFKITISFDEKHNPHRLSFNGSLPKFYYGNNLIHLDWDKTQDAIQMLSDSLNVNISEAILMRVDFGINIPLKHSIYEYINCFLAYPRLETIRFKESVTFYTSTNTRSFIYYDKLKEMSNKKKNNFYNQFINENVLRYEIQLKKHLKRRFRLKEMKVKHLFCDTIQNKLLEYWFNGYKKVKKQALGIDPEYLLKGHNGLQKYLSYHGIQRLGYDRINSKISEQIFNVSNNRVKKSKMRGQIKKLLKEVNKNALDNRLIEELDEKMIFIRDFIISNKSVPYFISEKEYKF
ncbi:MAG: hypothetical protein CSA38_02630 [Flavobacteriales bacterium]|nr:MAG: hypothetical protein CSA38_02630 [Flavobacteriales bacterium]